MKRRHAGKRFLTVGILLCILGGILAATWNGYGAYAMVGLQIVGIALLAIGAIRFLTNRNWRPANAGP